MNNMYQTPQLGFGEAISEAMKKIATFTGRSRRSEYWWCMLLVAIANIVANFIPYLGTIISIVLGLACIPLTFRRLHDTGHSGWWYGIGIILEVILIATAVTSVISKGVDLGSIQTDQTQAVEFLKAIFCNPLVLITGLLSIIIGIIVFVFTLLDSKPGMNKYGDSPKYPSESSDTFDAAQQ
jgi:uncharacterized membrane protein YhaH (DUF805 family)